MTSLSERVARMTHGSLFAGIGGFDLGFERAGFNTRWQVEKEPFCQAVLKSRWPEAELLEDICECGAHNLSPVECITAGVPCQDVSVAGKRAGLAGERTGLFYEFARILRELRPTWFVFENVPGLFSSNGGRDFAEVLRVLMVECGYGVSWRVLDSQFFGVAQRRRRMFIVGRFGKPCPAEILFERESGSGNFAPGRETRQGTTARPARSTDIVSQAITAKWAKGSSGPAGDEHHNLVVASLRSADGHHGRSSPRGDGCDNLVCGPLKSAGRNGGYMPNAEEAAEGHIVVAPLKASDAKNFAGSGQGNDGVGTIIYAIQQNDGGKHKRKDRPAGGMYVKETDKALTIGTTDLTAARSAPPDPNGVRDFAGLPEGLDSARYRALGNAVTTQVAEWIGRRIMEIRA